MTFRLETQNTNFNSIVNSNILLSKLLLEIRLPEELICGKKEEKQVRQHDQNLTESIEGIHFNPSNVNYRPIEFQQRPIMFPYFPQLVRLQIPPQFFELHQKAQLDYFHRSAMINMNMKMAGIHPIYRHQVFPMQQFNHQLMQNQFNNQIVTNTIQPQMINKKKMDLIQNFIRIHEGQCNFYIFMNSCKPYLFKTDTDNFVTNGLKIEQNGLRVIF